jgi:putative ABC transport system permease protein
VARILWALLTVGADLRNALRHVKKSPGFTAVAALTLALGIGISTTTFTWLRATWFGVLPVDAPERIALIWSSSPSRGVGRSPSSVADYHDWQTSSASFEALAAAVPASYNVADVNANARVAALRVTHAFFQILTAAPIEGRLLQREDESADARVVVLSERFWKARFGRDSSIVGRTLSLDGQPYVVVGVADAAASVLPFDMWTPLALRESPMARDRREVFVIGRFRSNVTIDQAQAELASLAARLAQTYPDSNDEWSVQLVSLRDSILGPDTNAFAAVFTGAVIFVLLIGCANIANLLLARGLGRAQEVAIRVALGAERRRLIRQFLTESLVVAMLGGAAGLLVAVWLNDVLRGTVLGATPFAADVRIDGTVLLFTSAISVVAALVFGTAPAMRNSVVEVQSALKLGPGIGPAPRSRLRQIIVAGEIALATALLIVAIVLIQTGIAIRTADPGFDPSHLLTARIALPEASYPSDERVTAFYTETIEALAGRPEATDVAVTSRLPLAGGSNPNRSIEVDGTMADSDRAWAIDVVISPAYFRTFRIPIVEGRAFTETDVFGAPFVAVVSETFATRYLAGRQALGRRIRIGGTGAPLTVVGVAADVRNDDLGQPPAPQVYLPHAQHSARQMSIVVRTAAEPNVFRAEMEDVIRRFDPTLTLSQVRTMEQVIEADLPDVPVIIGILAVCSTLALLLASLGIYGVVAYSVRQQFREFAIRMAIGASRRDIVVLAVGRTVRWSAAGLIAGVAAALAITRVLVHAVDFVEGVEPLMLAITLSTLTLAILAASWLPARTAGRIDPAVAMRVE